MPDAKTTDEERWDKSKLEHLAPRNMNEVPNGNKFMQYIDFEDLRRWFCDRDHDLQLSLNEIMEGVNIQPEDYAPAPTKSFDGKLSFMKIQKTYNENYLPTNNPNWEAFSPVKMWLEPRWAILRRFF